MERRAELSRLQETIALIETELQRAELSEELRAAYSAHLADIRPW